jgi:2-aminoadipate transaminase
MTIQWPDLYAERTQHLTGSAIRELLKLTQNPEVISFGGGMPAPELFPLREVEEACHRVMAKSGREALQYGATDGYPPLRAMIARHTARYGIRVKPANVLITTGSQQALDLIAKLFIDDGDKVIVDAPTYLGALQSFNLFGAAYASIPMDDCGLDVRVLKAALRTRPKFMYLLPNFQNPTGLTMSLERRRAVVELAAANSVPIVEDDPYGQLRYEGDHLPSLALLDSLAHPDGRKSGEPPSNVIYLSTFSKTLAPGLRLGWIIAPTDVITKLTLLKQGADLHSSTFAQVVAYEVGRGGFLDRHVRNLRQEYRRRRDVMLEALAHNFPESWGVTWTRPAGGLFLWVRLPAGMDTQVLLSAALEQNVAFVPGVSFFAPDYPRQEAARYMRLNFSYAEPERIREGIRRLAAAIGLELGERVPYAASLA